MAAPRWIIASLIALLALFLGNYFALTLPYDLARKFYIVEKVIVAEIGALILCWILCGTQ